MVDLRDEFCNAEKSDSNFKCGCVGAFIEEVNAF